jgi:hypothetical protein
LEAVGFLGDAGELDTAGENGVGGVEIGAAVGGFGGFVFEEIRQDEPPVALERCFPEEMSRIRHPANARLCFFHA